MSKSTALFLLDLSFLFPRRVARWFYVKFGYLPMLNLLFTFFEYKYKYNAYSIEEMHIIGFTHIEEMHVL